MGISIYHEVKSVDIRREEGSRHVIEFIHTNGTKFEIRFKCKNTDLMLKQFSTAAKCLMMVDSK